MSIVIETGTGDPQADTYASTEDADSYFAKRGITIWVNLTTTEKEQALVRATGYMLQVYRGRWLGARRNSVQALDWPRANVVLTADGAYLYGFNWFPFDQVPREVKNACIELALRASIGELLEDLPQAIVRETVGPITTVYDQYSSRQKKFAAIDGILSPFLKSGGNGSVVKLGRC